MRFNYVILYGIALSLILLLSTFSASSQLSQKNNASTDTATDRDANQTKSLLVSIGIAKNPIAPETKETSTVTVSDADSHQRVVGASVDGEVKYVSPTIKRFFNTTNQSGQVSYTWDIERDSPPGTYTVTAQSSAAGYPTASNTTTFEVIPAAAPGP